MQTSSRGDLREITRKCFGAFCLILTLSAAPAAHADDWGCQVLLCLANPQGPTAVAQCVPPITKLWTALAAGHPFPQCSMAGADNYAQPVVNYYNNCPAGTSPAAAGQSVIQATGPLPSVSYAQSVSTGIGTGEGLYPGSQGLSNLTLPPLVCVGGAAQGTTLVSTGGMSFIEATAYPQVVNLPPQENGNVINVYVNNALYTQVRY